MLPIQHDHMIQEIAPDTAHPALGNAVLPRTAKCRPDRLAAHRLYGRDHVGTKLRIAIQDQEALQPVAVFPGFMQLQRNPQGIGVSGHVVVQDAPSVVADHEQAVEHAKA
jgi:hypothetical protein